MNVWITGDTHGRDGLTNRIFDWEITKNPSVEDELWDEQKSVLTKDDLLIVAGDFGCIWNNNPSDETEDVLNYDYLLPGKNGESPQEKTLLDKLETYKCTIAFLDGNHDNHIRLNTYPVKEWNGGKVHQIRSNIFHLIRGEIYTIDGKKIFCFGGAASHDIKDGIIDPKDFESYEQCLNTIHLRYRRYEMFRIKNVSWWAEELPSMEEMGNAIENLKKHDYKVDYIITHSPPANLIVQLGHGSYKVDWFEEWLNNIARDIDFKRWYFGHMHCDRAINKEYIGLYYNIERII